MKKTGWFIAGILVGAFYFSTGLADNLNASASLTTPNPADIHATAGR